MSNYSNPEFRDAMQELQSTVDAGNFSAEGIEFLISKAIRAATADTYAEEIILTVVMKCWRKSPQNTEKFYDLVIPNYDEELFRKALQNLNITLSLENLFYQSQPQKEVTKWTLLKMRSTIYLKKLQIFLLKKFAKITEILRKFKLIQSK